MKLSKHFELVEFTKSQTADLKHIDNNPSEQVIRNLQSLCELILEPLRETINVPIFVTSGYRSRLLNKVVGGAGNSQHMSGHAADIRPANYDIDKCLEILKANKNVDQCIDERRNQGKTRWIHVSWSNAPRHQFFKISK